MIGLFIATFMIRFLMGACSIVAFALVQSGKVDD